MVCLTPNDEYSKHDNRAESNRDQQSEKTSFTRRYFEKYQTKLQEHFEYALQTHDSVSKEMKLLISQLSADTIFDLIEQFYDFKIKSNEIERAVNKTQQQLATITNGSEPDQYGDLKSDIRRLKKDVKQLELKLEEINNCSQKRVSREQISIPEINIELADQSETIESAEEETHLDHSVLGHSLKHQSNDNPLLSYLLLRQMSPSIIDIDENELDLTQIENEMYSEEEEDDDDNEPVAEFISSETTDKINQKVHLANNIVSVMKGPMKVMLDGTMHAAEIFAKGKHASESIVQAVEKGLARQKQMAMEGHKNNNSVKPAYAEITSDWIFEGENADKGFSSASVWMRDPDGHRILVKTQDLPIGAANEWIAYVLGRYIGLPVNKVQIGIYEKNLVTLHTDVTKENEKTITLLDLSRRVRKTLMADPIIGSMDLFDHIIQNVDRNPRNILITTPATTNANDVTAKLKIHLIDHGACFGMGKLNGISIIATKMRTRHLSIVKFDPAEQAKKFDRYLSKVSVTDRILMKKTLNRFAAITDNQIDAWLTEVQDLLSSSQYNRIYGVLYRQRDIAIRYTMQWGISPRSSSVKSIQQNHIKPEMNDTEAYF